VGSIPASRTNFFKRMAQKKFWAIFLFRSPSLQRESGFVTAALARQASHFAAINRSSISLAGMRALPDRNLSRRDVGRCRRFRSNPDNFFLPLMQ
jgi:hypothetical protein